MRLRIRRVIAALVRWLATATVRTAVAFAVGVAFGVAAGLAVLFAAWALRGLRSAEAAG